MCQSFLSASQPPPLSCWLRSLTQLEVSVQDASLVQILESRKDLPQIVTHLWLQQGVPGLPDVGQRLQRATASASGLPFLTFPPSVLEEEETGLQFSVLRPPLFPSPSLSLTFRLQSSRKMYMLSASSKWCEKRTIWRCCRPRCSSISFKICNRRAGLSSFGPLSLPHSSSAGPGPAPTFSR